MEYRPSTHLRYLTAPFWREEFPDIMAAADLIVSRAGANALFEIAALGKPAILIPLSLSGSRGDQIRNAQYFEQRGAALVLDERRDGPQRLLDMVRQIMEDQSKRREMGKRMKELGMPRSSETIARLILERIF
jgi:UDP-N-acetylglucosamine--N-acetylmuramyl-(pentapeptide) pyrophosphoryl-undecaprenol N-acetylglucosamine transferase